MAARGPAGRLLLERTNQRILNAEHYIRIEVCVAIQEHMRDQRTISVRADEVVYVRGTERMPTLRGKHLADGAIMRNRTVTRHDRAKPVTAALVGAKACPSRQRNVF
jgi:hypothetical protein